jgi:DNA-binding HxlR family transcriptional regulator
MAKTLPSPPKRSRSGCPISTTLDHVGDKWTLILIRDMVMGKTRYGAFLESPEGIPTNILADRLKRMETAGLVEKHAYQDRPTRFDYRLTPMGRGLVPVLQEICKWADVHFPDTWTPPPAFMAFRP